MAPETILLSIVILGAVAAINYFASLALLHLAEGDLPTRVVRLSVGAVAAISYAAAVILAVSPIIAFMWKIVIL